MADKNTQDQMERIFQNAKQFYLHYAEKRHGSNEAEYEKDMRRYDAVIANARRQVQGHEKSFIAYAKARVEAGADAVVNALKTSGNPQAEHFTARLAAEKNNDQDTNIFYWFTLTDLLGTGMPQWDATKLPAALSAKEKELALEFAGYFGDSAQRPYAVAGRDMLTIAHDNAMHRLAYYFIKAELKHPELTHLQQQLCKTMAQLDKAPQTKDAPTPTALQQKLESTERAVRKRIEQDFSTFSPEIRDRLAHGIQFMATQDAARLHIAVKAPGEMIWKGQDNPGLPKVPAIKKVNPPHPEMIQAVEAVKRLLEDVENANKKQQVPPVKAPAKEIPKPKGNSMVVDPEELKARVAALGGDKIPLGGNMPGVGASLLRDKGKAL